MPTWLDGASRCRRCHRLRHGADSPVRYISWSGWIYFSMAILVPVHRRYLRRRDACENTARTFSRTSGCCSASRFSRRASRFSGGTRLRPGRRDRRDNYFRDRISAARVGDHAERHAPVRDDPAKLRRDGAALRLPRRRYPLSHLGLGTLGDAGSRKLAGFAAREIFGRAYSEVDRLRGNSFPLFRIIFGYRWSDFGLQFAGLRALAGNHLLVVLVLSAAILLFQYFPAAARRRSGGANFTRVSSPSGCPSASPGSSSRPAWWRNSFFAALLQTRLAAWFKSEISGVALMALLFGLAHAPGFILRHAGLAEAIGENPTAGRCHCLRDCGSLGQRHLFRDRLGADEESRLR